MFGPLANLEDPTTANFSCDNNWHQLGMQASLRGCKEPTNPVPDLLGLDRK